MTNDASTEVALAKTAIARSSADTFSFLMEKEKFEHLYRVASMYSKSNMVPSQFQNNPGNCMIAISMATRLGMDPFMFMQSCYVIHNKPAIESKVAIGLFNKSGMVSGCIRYTFDGKGDDYGCSAIATTKDGKEIVGPKVTWKLVKAEGWDKKTGSKWKTMPDLMFSYRAAMFLIRTHFPDVILGMHSVDELEDMYEASRPQPTQATSKVSKITSEVISTNEDSTEAEPSDVEAEDAGDEDVAF